jgi:hypothetical protein
MCRREMVAARTQLEDEAVFRTSHEQAKSFQNVHKLNP